MTYEEQLRDDRWKYFRELVLERDLRLCQYCSSSRNLQAHHFYYVKGHMAWEYPLSALITLCGKCHEQWHEDHTARVLDEPVRTLGDIFAFIHETLESIKILDERIAERQRREAVRG